MSFKSGKLWVFFINFSFPFYLLFHEFQLVAYLTSWIILFCYSFLYCFPSHHSLYFLNLLSTFSFHINLQNIVHVLTLPFFPMISSSCLMNEIPLLVFPRKYLILSLFFPSPYIVYDPSKFHLFTVLVFVITVGRFLQIFGEPGSVLIFKVMVLNCCFRFSVHNGEVHKRLCKESYAYLSRPVHRGTSNVIVFYRLDSHGRIYTFPA